MPEISPHPVKKLSVVNMASQAIDGITNTPSNCSIKCSHKISLKNALFKEM